MAVMFWGLLVICLLVGWWEKVTGDCETFCICVVANQKGTVDRIRGRTCSYLISLCALPVVWVCWNDGEASLYPTADHYRRRDIIRWSWGQVDLPHAGIPGS